MLPNLATAVMAWTQPFTFERITKAIVDFELVETRSLTAFTGVVAPLKQTDLEIKPEGQRQWRWLEIHSTTNLEFALDDRFVFKGKMYRVMAVNDWADYGYFRYEVAQAFDVELYEFALTSQSENIVTSDNLDFVVRV